ncbi:hypothetical protein [Congregibacter litoralis]|uniref:Uncharacterized protein n=1 Tax=Congregibacter litoralis KT71 TaxID=314285 RepID=A4ABC8_9GAMM|nr:hypothetical protein [Congregibacter litoralis]EAQ96682.2 hypothetical protein KT71_06654 [Congregibacter litoralis KT71]
MRSSPLLLIALVAALFSQQSASRTIWLAGDHHESMTLDSLYCAEISPTTPMACGTRPDDWTPAFDLSNIDLGVWNEDRVKDAVRYPDDPVSELRFSNPVGLVRWLWNVGIGCKRMGKDADIQTGLRCSTHYGNLQFMHAMSSDVRTDATQTKSKIMAWIDFSLAVLQNHPNADGILFIQDIHCNYWTGQKDNNGNPIADLMVPNGEDEFPCVVNKGSPWFVGSLFAFRCNVNIYSCDVDMTPQHVRSNALGAILHLIQDSYSQGHALRGNCCANVPDHALAAYECAPITQFNVYGPQDKGRHGAADDVPVAGESCAQNSGVLDPVVAGAQVFWLLKHGGVAEENIASIAGMLNTQVFRLSDTALPSGKGAGF